MGEAGEYRRSSTGRRAITATGVGVLAAVTLLLVFAPWSQAAGVHKTVFKPAWKGALSGVGVSVVHYGCGKYTSGTPTWSATTGKFGWAGSAKAPSCPAATVGGNFGSASVDLWLYVPFNATKGHHTIIVNATYTATISTTFKGGKCTLNLSASYTDCTREAQVTFDAYPNLVDSTNSSWYASLSHAWSGIHKHVYNDSYCYTGSCSYSHGGTPGNLSVSDSVSWWFNATKMVSTGHYWLELETMMYVYSEGSAFGATLTGFNGSASANFATLGNGGSLNSITVL
jgi:hypothetical protein